MIDSHCLDIHMVVKHTWEWAEQISGRGDNLLLFYFVTEMLLSRNVGKKHEEPQTLSIFLDSVYQ